MTTISAEFAANILWAAWYATWILAVFWSARTKVQLGADMIGLPRFLLSLGAVLLFVPSASGPVFGEAFLDLCTEKLWHEPVWLSWILFALIAAGFGFCWWARLHLG